MSANMLHGAQLAVSMTGGQSSYSLKGLIQWQDFQWEEVQVCQSTGTTQYIVPSLLLQPSWQRLIKQYRVQTHYLWGWGCLNWTPICMLCSSSCCSSFVPRVIMMGTPLIIQDSPPVRSVPHSGWCSILQHEIISNKQNCSISPQLR